MSKVQTLRDFVHLRLSAAAEEIFDVFKRTIAEYEEELCRQHKLLEAAYKPEVRLHRADVQQLLASKQRVPPEQLERSPGLDQEDPPEPPHMKEEHCSSQGGEQLRGPEEADISKFTVTRVPVKSEEDDGEKPSSSQLHQRHTEGTTEADGEDCGESEPARNFNPDHLQPDPDEQASGCSESDTDDSCDWKETREPQSGLNSLQNNEAAAGDMDCGPAETSVSSSESAAGFVHKGRLLKHSGLRTGKERSTRSDCGKNYTQKKSFEAHVGFHSNGNVFSCLVCKKTLKGRTCSVAHTRIHTGEKPFSCSVCGMKFSRKDTLKVHGRVHTGEKPFACSVCNTCFSCKSTLNTHMRRHTGEKPFCCSLCGKRFSRCESLNQHSARHTGEKLFSCSICGTKFVSKYFLKQLLAVHS